MPEKKLKKKWHPNKIEIKKTIHRKLPSQNKKIQSHADFTDTLKSQGAGEKIDIYIILYKDRDPHVGGYTSWI